MTTYSVTFNDSNGTAAEIGDFPSEAAADELADFLKEHLGDGSPANVTVNEEDS